MEYKQRLGKMERIERWKELRDKVKGDLVRKKVKIGKKGKQMVGWGISGGEEKP